MGGHTTRRLNGIKLLRAYTVCISGDDSTLATLSRDVVLWDISAGAKRCRVHPVTHPSSCDFNGDGSRLAIKTTSGMIVSIETLTGEDSYVIADGREGEGANLKYSCCSQYLVDGSWRGSVIVRDATTGEAAFSRRREGEMVKAVATDVERQIWAIHHSYKSRTGSPRPDYISVWTWPFQEPRIFQHKSRFVRGMAVSSDGLLLATCAWVPSEGYHLTLHWLSDFELVSSAWMEEAAGVRKVVWSPRNTEIAVVCRDGFIFYETSDLAPTAEFALESASDAAYSNADGLIALGGWSSGRLLAREAISSPSPGR